MTKVAVVGMGYVGDAVAYSLPVETTVCYDPITRPYGPSLKDVKACDAIVVCVPTPSRYDGSCNTTVLHKVLDDINYGTPFEGVIICKSTAPPDFYSSISKRYVNVVHVPEFLRASSAREDYTHSSFAVFGGNPGWTHEAEKVLTQRKYNPARRLHMSIEAAAMYKYMSNSFLASKVVWMNQFKQLADSLNVSWDDLVSVTEVDKRIGSSHMQVPGPDGSFGYGGSCFPKDVDAILSLAENNKVDMSVLKEVVASNDILRSMT